MKVKQAAYRIAPMCRLLGVSPSGYYAYWKREPSARSKRDAQLKARIQAIHSWSRGTYGAPRMHAELADEGTHVGRKRAARLLREAAARASLGFGRGESTQKDAHDTPRSRCPPGAGSGRASLRGFAAGRTVGC